ncbi:MAG: enoyl-CoA hydratase/isomerase family protein [Planctomycetes bacterium]|nr:enoyl-CoA hydratase/isomerase family protein [Planctomycetota bacterium]
MMGTAMEAAVRAGQKAFRLEEDGDGIAILTFDLPGEKVNKLTGQALLELRKLMEEIAQNGKIRCLIIQGGKEETGVFIAGADIEEILSIADPAEASAKARLGQEAISQLSRLPQPVIAAVHGKCLGGGTELILSCDFRIASDHPATAIGLPEVNLGIIPGFGGTQRLPRLIGLQAALDLILTGKTVDARKAARLGLVDQLAPLPLLGQAALRFARQVLEKGGKKFRARRPRRRLGARLLEGTGPGRRLMRRLAEKEVEKRTGGHYPAPVKALQAVFEGIRKPLEDGLRLEADLVGGLIASPVSKNLIDIFQDSERLRRGKSAAPASAAAKEMTPPEAEWKQAPRSIGILGAGVMGGAIAALLAQKGFRARLKDIKGEAIAAGLRQAKKAFDALVERRRMKPGERDNALAAIMPSAQATGFRHVECVIEAVVEDMKVKRAVLEEIEPHLAEAAIFATNTSSLSIDELAQAARRPERVAGFHFFNPVHRMPLIEVVVGEKTSEGTLERLEDLARELGKYPLRVKNGPGFLVNRLLTPYLNEAAYLFEEGYRMEAIDQAALRFGLPMGPFLLLDEVGLDVAGKVGHYLHQILGERMAPAALLPKLLELKLLGKKGGAGFYLHRGRKEPAPNPKVLSLGGRGAGSGGPELWIRRMLYPMVNEAARCLEEKIVGEPWQVDIAMVMGTGFPPFRGGPLRWADSIGLKDVLQGLEEFAGNVSAARFQPAALLKDLAGAGRGFYR